MARGTDYYAYFRAMSDASLKSAWMLWGRESEDECTQRELDRWAAVNMEMHHRGLFDDKFPSI